MNGKTMEPTTATSERWFNNRNIFVDILIVCYGIGSWIGVSSTYLQLPLIVKTAPEGWTLPSFLAFIVQSGNIALAIYVLYQKYSTKKINDGYLIYVIYMIGASAALGMAFLYQTTFDFVGKQRSLWLFLFMWMFSIVGCISSVLFMPYMGRFRDIYMVTYMVGQSLNGFLSSVMALIQGVGGPTVCVPSNSTDGPAYIPYTADPLFSIQTFFLIIFGLISLSGISFVLLNTLSICKKEYTAGTILHGNEYHYEKSENSEINKEYVPENVRNLSSTDYIVLMLSVSVICVTGNGLLPGLGTYYSIPYGNHIYHLANSLNSIAIPSACLIALFVPHTSIRTCKFMLFTLVLIAAYLIYVALLSPNPPFIDSSFGGMHVIVLSACFNFIFSFVKLSVTKILRYQGGKALVWLGTNAQFSSTIGAIIMFFLINFTNWFVSKDECADSDA